MGTVPFIAVFAIEFGTALALGAAAVVAWTGGWRFEWVTIRDPWRLVAIAAGLLALRWLVSRQNPGTLEPGNRGTLARVAAGALLVAGVLGWATHQSPYLGGADSYGYVSAADRLRGGALIHHEPLADVLPFNQSIFAAAPLGYVPAGRVANASVPAYPLGLPVMMALAQMVGGSRAPFYVAFTMGLLLLAVCVWLVHKWTQDLVIALTAAALIAFHPVVFAYAIQSMSDVPATALYLSAAALLMRNSRAAAAAGAIGALAFLVRPAMLPGTIALALIPLASGDRRIKRIGDFGVGIIAGIAVQAWLQWYLYGSAFANGYGNSGELFALSHVLPNLRSYGYWLAALHSIIWIVGIGLVNVRHRGFAGFALASFVAAVVPYAIYRTYDHWETLRFIMPLLIVLTMASTIGLMQFAQRRWPRAGGWIAFALVLVMIGQWVRWLEREHVLQLALAESRFKEAGELVTRATPANAVVLASLHSGSVRYYANRNTVDWGKMPPGSFDGSVQALRAHGFPVFVMLDGNEERAEFEQRHGQSIAGWLPAGQARDVRLFESR